MASIVIRRFDPDLESRLRVRAARHGRSMGEEARAILQASLADEQPRRANLAEAARELFGPLGGVELELPPRGPMRDPPRFNE